MTATDASPPWYEHVVLPALLDAARGPYRREIGKALRDAGFTDMPRHGPRLVGGIARNGPTVGEVATELVVSKQAASQLVDTLVLRGYIERAPDPKDRRRVMLDLTERGRAAAKESAKAVARVDRKLEKQIGAEEILKVRAALAVLAELDDPHFAHD